MKILPEYANKVMKSIASNIKTYHKSLPVHVYEQYTNLLCKINKLPVDIRERIGEHPELESILAKARKEQEELDLRSQEYLVL
ncbi:MAG: hypothetical protein AB1782_17780 [Cyanobacteriota bacterium]